MDWDVRWGWKEWNGEREKTGFDGTLVNEYGPILTHFVSAHMVMSVHVGEPVPV